MLYKINRDVPANTTAAAPDWQKLQVCQGTIEEWIIFCPDECADLMQFRVMYKGHQLLPFSKDEWMNAFPVPIKPTENLELSVSPYVLDIYAFNLDDSYSHEYNLYCNVLRKKPVSPTKTGFDIKAAWSNLFGGG